MTIAIWKKTFIRPNDLEYSNRWRYGEGNTYQGRSRESLDELYKAQQIDGIVLLLDVNKTEYIIKFTRNYYTAAGNAIIQAGYSSIINIPAGMAGARRWA